MESRKYQLQKQILEALNANDSALYSLLKSQWAHRFGVESLEELKNLDLSQMNQNLDNLNNQKIDQLQEKSFEDDNAINIKEDDNQGKEIKNKDFSTIQDETNDSFKIEQKEIIGKENNYNNYINPFKENKVQPKVKALIPLPPNPKYGYLKKWLL